MSRYPIEPFDLRRTRTRPLGDRPGKVDASSFARPHVKGASVAEFLDGLPAILGAQGLRELAQAIVRARGAGKPVIWGLGAHVIKTGLSPVLIDLMDRGLVSAVALNGAGVIHDYEIALVGSTSEDVASQLDEGAFGMAEETGRDVHRAVAEGASQGLGIGESLGAFLQRAGPPFGEFSLLLQAYLRSIPVTVHVTIGADVIHNHPACAASELGKASHQDFRLLASLVAGLNEGGVFLNCGSAVTLPEIFLKCVALVRNAGETLQDFTTANLDFLQHYRPQENVLKRPVNKGGKGIPLTGHHEIMIPLLAAAIIHVDA
jgi:deoxyhypusine synthase